MFKSECQETELNRQILIITHNDESQHGIDVADMADFSLMNDAERAETLAKNSMIQKKKS